MKRFLLASLGFALACSNAGSDLGPDPAQVRPLTVVLYLDRDGSGNQTPGDTAFTGARVELRPLGGGRPVQTAVSTRTGEAFFEVPVGYYAISVDPASIGDTLAVGNIDPDFVQLRFDDIPLVVTIRLTFGELSIRAVRQLPIGRRVLIRARVLAGVQVFRDTTSHVADTSSQIRLTRVALRGGLTGNLPGDSVTVLGTVSTRGGQPTLDQAVITLLGNRPPPIPVSLSTAGAAAAFGGVLDAGLVQITGALITDTATIAPDFLVVGNDGSGPVRVVLDAVTGINRATFIPGRSMTVRGVLVPVGDGTWALKPRGPEDTFVFVP